MLIGWLGLQNSLTIAASVTWASWGYGSPASLARIPTKLDLMPAMQGYPHSFGWVRPELPYQLWQTSFALRHGLAPRPIGCMVPSSVYESGTKIPALSSCYHYSIMRYNMQLSRLSYVWRRLVSDSS
jgi:hypothetical protein